MADQLQRSSSNCGSGEPAKNPFRISTLDIPKENTIYGYERIIYCHILHTVQNTCFETEVTMNTQEREQLTEFLQQLTHAQASQKDSEADTLIHEACMRQPDAAYLLVQRAMLLDHALQDSRAQIAHLQDELGKARAGISSGSFPNQYAWGTPSATQPNPVLQGPATATASLPAATPVPAASAWGSGMLGNIATTAAGVVAGGFLFQGIEHLLGNHGSNSGLLNGLSSNVSPDQRETPAINQHVDDSASNAGVFDTSSVDDFIDDDTGEIV